LAAPRAPESGRGDAGHACAGRGSLALRRDRDAPAGGRRGVGQRQSRVGGVVGRGGCADDAGPRAAESSGTAGDSQAAVITPRTTRLVRVSGQRALREALAALAFTGPSLAASGRVV